MQKEVSLLRESITIDTPLEQIVRKFKEIIDSQLDNPVYIFESVWFPFDDNGLFYFSLVASFKSPFYFEYHVGTVFFIPSYQLKIFLA